MVSKADIHKATVPASDGCEQALGFEASTSEVEAKQCVDGYMTPVKVCNTDSANNPGNSSNEPCWESDVKFWEVEADNTPIQMADVQGRLKKNKKFWQEVLQAPDTVLEYIENGYHLPFKFLPLCIASVITNQQRPIRNL